VAYGEQDAAAAELAPAVQDVPLAAHPALPNFPAATQHIDGLPTPEETPPVAMEVPTPPTIAVDVAGPPAAAPVAVGVPAPVFPGLVALALPPPPALIDFAAFLGAPPPSAELLPDLGAHIRDIVAGAPLPDLPLPLPTLTPGLPGAEAFAAGTPAALSPYFADDPQGGVGGYFDIAPAAGPAVTPTTALPLPAGTPIATPRPRSMLERWRSLSHREEAPARDPATVEGSAMAGASTALAEEDAVPPVADEEPVPMDIADDASIASSREDREDFLEPNLDDLVMAQPASETEALPRLPARPASPVADALPLDAISTNVPDAMMDDFDDIPGLSQSRLSSPPRDVEQHSAGVVTSASPAADHDIPAPASQMDVGESTVASEDERDELESDTSSIAISASKESDADRDNALLLQDAPPPATQDSLPGVPSSQSLTPPSDSQLDPEVHSDEDADGSIDEEYAAPSSRALTPPIEEKQATGNGTSATSSPLTEHPPSDYDADMCVTFLLSLSTDG
jgi:hypothetical protein